MTQRAALPLLLALALAVPATAQEPAAEPQSGTRYKIGFEWKSHYRDSDRARFPSPFSFPSDFLPPGATLGWLETVEPGGHVEVSAVTVTGEVEWREDLAARVKVDVVDRYDRNPTSDDEEVDLDELWLRYGREVEPGELADRSSFYVKAGKIPKFERQDDRHLESYGLLSTAFNRFEDVGLEVGAALGRHLYLRASYTQGNPLYFRDPGALAGDNGVEIFNLPGGAAPNPVPELGSGFPILYDTDADEIDFEHPETGLGLGVRFGGAAGSWTLDVLAWAYERELAPTVDLRNTFYGGDLDLLLGPGNATPPPGIHGDEKRELGANVRVYAGSFSFFGQYVDQELAGLDRKGFEVEVAWSFDLPLFASLGGRQLFPWIAPAVRYSELDPDFALDPIYPSPSIAWDWEKLDFGLRLGVYPGVDLTAEWQQNTFVRLGKEESADEFLLTLAIELDRER